ncbi:MAG: alpha/beta fold hydrolase [Microthrixaceae bacterium]
MPTCQLADVALEYELHGDGPRVLFLNGSGSTIDRVRPVIDVLATRCTVAIHDQRGMGRSSVPTPPYTMADYACDAVELVDSLGWDRCAVLGISFGGMVAQELAVTRPDRVERLALLCTSPGGPTTSSYPLHELRSLEPEQRAELAMTLLDSRFAEPGWFDDHPGDLGLVTLLAEQQDAQLTPEQQVGADAQMAARRGHDVRDRLRLITCPTLVASGTYDGIAPPSNGAVIAESIAGAEQRCYEGGHAFFVQDPRALPDVLDFLDPRP